MKIFYKSAILSACVLIGFNCIAQETCNVMMPSIAGKYEGECKRGKANGNGKAEGTDQYQGEFKDGFPNGKGTYQWKNGDAYVGVWLNGKRDGEGSMSYKKEGKADSLVTGFWKKDVYVGKFEKPYKIYSRSLQVTRTDVEFTPAKESEIIITLSNTTGNMPNLNGRITPKVKLGQISILKGSYIRLINVFDSNKQTSYKLESVIIPFRAKFRFGNQDVDAEFFESGTYLMNVSLNN